MYFSDIDFALNPLPVEIEFIEKFFILLIIGSAVDVAKIPPPINPQLMLFGFGSILFNVKIFVFELSLNSLYFHATTTDICKLLNSSRFDRNSEDIYRKIDKLGNKNFTYIYEKKLFKYYYKKNKPILAICRGFQLIADIYGIKLEKINNHVRKFHSLKIDRSKYIKDKSLKVNSYHNYCIKDLPKNLEIPDQDIYTNLKNSSLKFPKKNAKN